MRAEKMIIVFVKAPIPGRVKTRLCPPLVPEQAAGLYRAFVKDTLEAARKVPGARVRVAYDAAPAFPDPGWARLGVAHFPQRGADLGSRLADAFQRAFAAGAKKAVIIGSDMPDIRPRTIAKAFALLARKDVALGPAVDGGYYLIGLKKPAAFLFEAISWSSDKVLGETLSRIRKNGLRLGSLPSGSDVDAWPDLAALAETLARRKGKNARFTRRALERMQWK